MKFVLIHEGSTSEFSFEPFPDESFEQFRARLNNFLHVNQPVYCGRYSILEMAPSLEITKPVEPIRLTTCSPTEQPLLSTSTSLSSNCTSSTDECPQNLLPTPTTTHANKSHLLAPKTPTISPEHRDQNSSILPNAKQPEISQTVYLEKRCSLSAQFTANYCHNVNTRRVLKGCGNLPTSRRSRKEFQSASSEEQLRRRMRIMAEVALVRRRRDECEARERLQQQLNGTNQNANYTNTNDRGTPVRSSFESHWAEVRAHILSDERRYGMNRRDMQRLRHDLRRLLVAPLPRAQDAQPVAPSLVDGEGGQQRSREGESPSRRLHALRAQLARQRHEVHRVEREIREISAIVRNMRDCGKNGSKRR